VAEKTLEIPGGVYDPKAGGAHMRFWCSMHDPEAFWSRHPDVARCEATFLMGEDIGDQGYEVRLWLTREGWERALRPGVDRSDNAPFDAIGGPAPRGR
jgi:hypothetical protein